MAKTLAVIQSSYIPWKGYFDIINSADEFVLFDEVQFSKGSWRNRNRIKTSQGLRWLTIPIKHSGVFGQSIWDCRVAHPFWRKSHWETIQQSYRHARFFARFAPRFEALYRSDETRLSFINHAFIGTVCDILGISTPISWSSSYRRECDDPTMRLVELCRATKADRYLSGPAAKSYLRPERFAEAGISLAYMDYSRYPMYRQLHGDFVHEVSVLDLIFNEGSDGLRYLTRC